MQYILEWIKSLKNTDILLIWIWLNFIVPFQVEVRTLKLDWSHLSLNLLSKWWKLISVAISSILLSFWETNINILVLFLLALDQALKHCLCFPFLYSYSAYLWFILFPIIFVDNVFHRIYSCSPRLWSGVI